MRKWNTGICDKFNGKILIYYFLIIRVRVVGLY